MVLILLSWDLLNFSSGLAAMARVCIYSFAEEGGFMILSVLSSISCTTGKGTFFPNPNHLLPLKDSNFKLLIMLGIKL